MTWDQGRGEFIQYVSSDLYFPCAKYVRCSLNGFDVRNKNPCGGRGCGGGRGRERTGNELKTSSHPWPGLLTYMATGIWQTRPAAYLDKAKFEQDSD